MPGSGAGPQSTFNANASQPASTGGRIEAFLANPAIAQVLKDLYTDILPNRRLDVFTRMVNAGRFDYDLQCEEAPMAGVMAQLATLPRAEVGAWFAVIAAREDIALADLSVPTYYNNNDAISTQLQSYIRQSITPRALASWLIEKHGMKAFDVATISPRLLAQSHRSGNGPLPLAHLALPIDSLSIKDLQALADAARGTGFLDIVNDNGENIFYRIATAKDADNNPRLLDALSWILHRRPDLIASTDALGWTVLDRCVLQSFRTDGARQWVIESARMRLLLAAGGELHWQSPPGLSVAEALAYRKDGQSLQRVTKPDPRTRRPEI